MDLLKEINEWVQKGYDIRYLITNQVENGYQAEVLAGDMPNFTYSFFIEEMEEEIWDYSVDTLEEGFSMALEWLKNNRK
ncbi:hypothetical protein CVD28_00790 [Bacillus sp. M6-12]|uniref:hypothetical protein n=1 Tax=Bacillus sp. M6-12 TaxID=2054166 RepID=UPI000C776DB8|nr:hypothetical protein [Bacillus sp. M6-12]PLS18970.1 hypothetical protein CVD28_00790 [Bacillus sp. M6-12]